MGQHENKYGPPDGIDLARFLLRLAIFGVLFAAVLVVYGFFVRGVP